MNEATARHLNYGQDIIFTFGPYASIYTRNYHPATDFLMLFGSLFLGLCYAFVLLYTAKNRPTIHVVVLVYMAIFVAPQTDALLFSYPLILAIYIAKFISKTEQRFNIWQLLIITIIFAPLGLLPLIKGSLLPLCLTFIIAIACYLLYHRYRVLILLILISPIASMLILWILSGQSIFFLPSYLTTQVPIISGYTEAMALQGQVNIDVLAYILATIAIVWSLVAANKIPLHTRLFLSVCFLLFLFIAFKAGFTLYDGQSNGSVARGVVSMIFAALIVGFIVIDDTNKTACFGYSQSPKKIIAFVTPIVLGVYIYANIPTGYVFYNPHTIYVNSWYGLSYLRASKDSDSILKSRFEGSLDRIRQEYFVPTLQGTTDIYPWDQSYLLASNNQWNPRPIMQSYSAYTPLLAKLNEQHLRDNNAPDNIIFSVKTLSGRLPTIDDGLSWTALFDNYTLDKIDNDFKFIFLRKKSTLLTSSNFDVLHEGTYKIKESVTMPANNDFVYAEINLKPSLLGKLLGILYKPPHLFITLKFINGNTEQYRVSANMMESGFFISPLIRDTRDFAMVASGKIDYLNANIVESFIISPAKGGRAFWNPRYELKLKAYQMPEAQFAFPFDRIIDFPKNHADLKTIQCGINQGIEQVNGVSVVQPNLTASALLRVSGWSVASLQDAELAEETFLTLTDVKGKVRYVKTQPTNRPDVKVYFKQPNLPENVGFTASVDVATLQGEYKLGLARVRAGQLEKCLESVVPITLKAASHHESQ
jgi:hypothetical protein